MIQNPSDSVKCEQELLFMVRYDMQSDILEIKAVAEENRLSPQQILILLEEAKEYVSLSTIRRVIEPGSENRTFNYNSTIRPLKKVLCESSDFSKLDSITALARLEGLENVCARQAELIEVLHDQISQMKSDHGRICAQYEDAITLCKEQIAIKDTRMERKDAWIQDQRKQINELISKNEKLIAELRGRSEQGDY